MLVDAGALFDLESNAVRVALTRLCKRGLVDRDERGSYQLAAGTSPLRQLVDAWRRGDSRLRAWTGRWMCALQPRGLAARERRRSHVALRRVGFREGLDGLWVRPDNLRQTQDELGQDLEGLGLSAGAELFSGKGFAAELQTRWCSRLWDHRRFRAGHRAAQRNLERSTARLGRTSRHKALVETFFFGGAAIRSLVADPLLPDEVASGDARRALTDAMLKYDRIGRSIWMSFLETPALSRAPGQLLAV